MIEIKYFLLIVFILYPIVLSAQKDEELSSKFGLLDAKNIPQSSISSKHLKYKKFSKNEFTSEKIVWTTTNEGFLLAEHFELTWIENNWVETWCLKYYYDVNNNISEQLLQLNFGEGLENSSLDSNYYDMDNNLIQSIHYYWDDNIWNISGRTNYSYDSNNYMTEKLSQIRNGSIWENNYLNLYVYDNNGNLTNEYAKYWWPYGNDWADEMWYEFSYDDNNNLIKQINRHQNSDWTNLWRGLWSYDDNNNNIEFIDQSWQDTIWNNSVRETNTYTTLNTLSTTTVEFWRSDKWENNSKSSYQFEHFIDNQEVIFLIKEITMQFWSKSSQSWNATYYRDLYEYDSNYNLIELVYQRLENNELISYSKWIYDYYSPTKNTDLISKISKYKLSNCYPNPFNPSTTISYSIPSQNYVTLKLFDLLGREVATLVNKEQPQGNYEVDFDGSNLTSGIYFYRLQSGDFVKTKKMVLIQ